MYDDETYTVLHNKTEQMLALFVIKYIERILNCTINDNDNNDYYYYFSTSFSFMDLI